MFEDEFYGNDEQRALLRRGRDMAVLLGQGRAYTYYGRTVGVATPGDAGLEELVALVRLQGNSHFAEVPVEDAGPIEAALTSRGLVPVRYAKWQGDRAALKAAREIVARHAVPDDLTVHALDADTPASRMTAFAELALSCGVLPPSGDILRGLAKPAICLIAEDATGRVVSCAGSSEFAHPDHPRLGEQAWWGMLATDPARRGERLALILGAMTMLRMEETFGKSDFFTGVEPGNAPSEAVCKRMGLANIPYVTVGCADPAALKSGRMTK